MTTATKSRKPKSKPETNGTPAPEPVKKHWELESEANRERDPDRKRKILAMAAKLRAEQGAKEEIEDEDLATKIAYIRPIRDALFRWAEDQAGFGHIELRCFQDGSAAIEIDVNDTEGSGLRVVLHCNITIDG
jgi:hypothetical protein